MKNLNMYLPLINGNCHDLHFVNGRDVIHSLLSDDWGPPPRSLEIEAETDDGQVVCISIPYSNEDKAIVVIKNK